MAIGVAELAVKAVPGIRLKPVAFEPGTSELNEDAAAYLQQVATIMKDRPDLKVAVCGLATEKDRSFLSQQDENQGADASTIDTRLLELARKRAEIIEDHLVSQHAIKNSRIFICKPELDLDAEGQPRVYLLI
jgi:outer membrane protein OmpA-like peptidoglycan-associated protein